MFKASFSFLTCIGILLSACGTSTPNGLGTTDTTGNPPVETRAPNSDYKPAFAGQTRIGSVKTTTPYDGTVVTNGLSKPWGLTALPDGRLLITEKDGKLRIVTTAGQIGEPITGLPAVVKGGQGGLLGVTLDPDFASNRMVYWVFSEAAQGGNLTAAAKGKLS
ncbi:MAG TPA: PQQ-dependent sugar dehydrogenase, partial [Flavisolibacter sp.]